MGKETGNVLGAKWEEIFKILRYIWLSSLPSPFLHSVSENVSKSNRTNEEINPAMEIQFVRKVTVHLGYGRVQLKCDGTRWLTGGEVRKVAVSLRKVLEVTSTSVYTGLNPFNFIREHFLQIWLCLSAERLSNARYFVVLFCFPLSYIFVSCLCLSFSVCLLCIYFCSCFFLLLLNTLFKDAVSR
jgi:hypothetical protein